MGIGSLQKMLTETPVRQESGFVLADKRVSFSALFQDLHLALIVATRDELHGEEMRRRLNYVEGSILEIHKAGDVNDADDAFKAYCVLLNEYGLS